MGDGPQPVVIVTGAGGRLGAAISAALAARGASLILVDVSEEAVGAASARLNGVTVVPVAGDLTVEGQAERAVARAIEVFGRIDALVNNAGIEGPVGPIESIALADVRRVFEVNVFGLLRMTQTVLPYMTRHGAGRIVNIASGAGLAGSGFMAPYSASKHAVIGLTRSIAQEVAAQGVSVNAVCPGCVDSPMMDRIETRLGVLKGTPVSFAPAIPIGRYAAPSEVADLVAYLTLEAPAYVTGAALVIDGGLRA